MSDLMRQIPFGQLMDWALIEYYTEGTVFGVRKLFDFVGESEYEIFQRKLELPFGPAAGPHTQLAQNLVAGYVAGARFFELKTVQVLDGEDLPVSKPCIRAADEGYNVEWSTELYVPQALEEYIKGFFAIKLLSRELGLGGSDGFVFNMSVGYDLEGIKTTKIDNFIEGLKNAENTDCWNSCKQWALDNLTRFKYVDKQFIDDIEAEICNSITLSTLHGCPPDEIERIATYLMKEKGLHTYIKCNPTLLGYEYARETLDLLGFDYLSFDDSHFKADLQFDDAVPMLKRLQSLADSLSLEFGVKLTNTFPVRIEEGELPGEEMYMSGRSLFPLSIEAANRLSKAFDGKLRISFSGGVDVRNISDVLEVGIWPITLATTLLKPGGYERLHQMANRLLSTGVKPRKTIDIKALQLLISQIDTQPMYKKTSTLQPKRKINEKVPLMDCFTVPCKKGCPFGQDVPAYLRLVGEGKYLEALKVIAVRNPLPFITGTICSHNCMTKCTRHYYEGAVNIRAAKLEAATEAFEQLLEEIKASNSQNLQNRKFAAPQKPNNVHSGCKGGTLQTNNRTAIVGGGPAGLAAAYFISRAGYPVTLFEKREFLGGIVKYVIPKFRIDDIAIENDISLALATGTEVRLNSEIGDIEVLRTEGFEHIIVATGAWEPSELNLESDADIVDALEFLEGLKSDAEEERNCKDIIVIGGGNTAMDTARAAIRIPSVESVSLVYRRTKRYMPADFEEIELALEDGVRLYELHAPLKYYKGVLTCSIMKLGEPDGSGRRMPVPTDDTIELTADTVISATGNKVSNKLVSNDIENVYVIGDASRGPATIAEAIADAMNCADTIIRTIEGNVNDPAFDDNLSTDASADGMNIGTSDAFENLSFDKYSHLNINTDVNSARNKKGIHYFGKEDCNVSELCLECPTICEFCVDVCPNRANIRVSVDGRPQVFHIDFMCNECGNCETFCPYDSAPYLEKFTFFIYEEDFIDSDNPGFHLSQNGEIHLRLDGEEGVHIDDSKMPQEIWRLIEAFVKNAL